MIRFKKLDQGGLTACNHSKNTCPHTMTCKRRIEGVKAYDLHDPEDSICIFYVEHETLRDERKIFRGRGRRHNAHAAPAGSSLPREPNLMVKRHIRDGKDINNE